MDLHPMGYTGETDLDKIKARQKMDEVRGMRRRTGLILAIFLGIVILALLAFGARRRSVIGLFPPSPAGSEPR